MLHVVPENELLNSLDIEQVRKLQQAILDDIQSLREQWANLSELADPEYDPIILEIFARLDRLEWDFLPQIEKRLLQKPTNTVLAA